VSLDDVKLHLVDDFDTAQRLMTWLGSRDAEGHIAVDTETTGLVIGQDRVRLAQVGGHVHGWAVPFHRWSGLIDDVVRRYPGRFDMHNAKFDAGMLDNMGEQSVHVPRDRIDDTRVMSHVREPNMSTALKSQASRHVDALAAGAQGVLSSAVGKVGGWTWATVPIDHGPYWQYAALDTVLTHHLRDHHWALADQYDHAAFDLENAYTWVAEQMERNGAHIDVPYARRQRDKFDAFVEEASAWVLDTYHVAAGSNASIIKILQGEGYIFDKKTASGAAALDKEVLAHIHHPLAVTILKRRQLQKLSTTYLRHFIEEVDAEDCIHPSINTLGARTSRTSMERPNLQNLPRKSESNPAATTIRNSFTTRYDDGTLLMCDFDQIEMRLLAHLSDDPGLIAAFASKEDFFVQLARDIFQDPTLEKPDPRRQLTKNTGYAKIYGAGIAKMALTAGVSEDAARATMNRFDALYPGVRVFQQAVERAAWSRQKSEGVGYARTTLTRRRMIADTNKIYALVNYLIQGSAAETFKLKQLQLDALGLGAYMLTPVHDEIILDVPTSDVANVVDALRSVMNDTTLYRVPITASVSAGRRWGEKIDLED
jgi:DNA polymerase-1